MFETLGPVQGIINIEDWELARPFKIARGIQTHVSFIVVTLRSGSFVGRGECCPVPYFGESTESVVAQIEAMLALLETGQSWDSLHDSQPAGAARNAVDCALWDLLAKTTSKSVWQLAGLKQPTPCETVFTISLDTPEIMAAQAAEANGYGTLKIKLGTDNDIPRLKAVRKAAPHARMIVDANEGWTRDLLLEYLPVIEALDIQMVEQPLHASLDPELEGIETTALLGADESCHTKADLQALIGLYDIINIKLDKTGGLTEALGLMKAAKKAGLETMVGCMLGTSLAMAPTMLLAPSCRFVDLDAPLLMGKDRAPALTYTGGTIQPPTPALWG